MSANLNERADDATLSLKGVIATVDIFSQARAEAVPDHLPEALELMRRQLVDVLAVLRDLHDTNLRRNEQ